MTQRINTLTLSRREQDGIRYLFSRSFDLRNPVGQFGANNLVGHNLPARMLEWAELTKSFGVGLIRNLPPLATLPKTPTSSQKKVCGSEPYDWLTAVCSKLFGHIYQLEQKVYPNLIHDVFPIHHQDKKELGTGSGELAWHVEDGLHPNRADWLGILCVRGDQTTETKVARFQDFKLSPNFTKKLLNTRFSIHLDTSFTDDIAGRNARVHLLKKHRDRYEFVFDPAFTVIESTIQQQLLSEIQHRAEQSALRINLISGDFLVLDNRTCIHARSKMFPRFDGNDRWIKRALIWRNMQKETNNSYISNASMLEKMAPNR